MNVDKFGLHLYKRKLKNKDTRWWENTNDGNISAQSIIIKHLQNPIDADDSATKGYVDISLENCLNKLKYLEEFLKEVNNKVTVLETHFKNKNEQSRRHK